MLVPLFEEDGEARVILTKRPETMPTHQGEIAFPGGRHDVGLDADLRATALREAEEEIGLAWKKVRVVAQLDGIATVGSRFTITPFVGLLDGRPQLTPHPTEVVSVFDVALSDLLDPQAYHSERGDSATGSSSSSTSSSCRARRSGAPPRGSSPGSSRTSARSP